MLGATNVNTAEARGEPVTDAKTSVAGMRNMLFAATVPAVTVPAVSVLPVSPIKATVNGAAVLELFTKKKLGETFALMLNHGDCNTTPLRLHLPTFDSVCVAVIAPVLPVRVKLNDCSTIAAEAGFAYVAQMYAPVVGVNGALIVLKPVIPLVAQPAGNAEVAPHVNEV